MAKKTAYIALGSNLGDRVKALEAAVLKLRDLELSRFKGLSHVYETSPVDAEGGSFLNAVAVIETSLESGVLLETLLTMEADMGRLRTPGRGLSRPIDLDLLMLDNTVIDSEKLTLPHPRMLRRRFVMEPLAELAPGLKIPPTGITAAEAAVDLERKHPEQEVRRLGQLEKLKKVEG